VAPVLIPNDKHHFAGLQRRLQAYDRNLWLIWSPYIRRWIVVLKSPRAVKTHYSLRGLPGCCHTRCHFEVATILVGHGGKYVDPNAVANLVLVAVQRNDQRHFSVLERMREADRRQDEREEKARREHRALVREIAGHAFSTAGVGKVIGSSSGYTDYVRNLRGKN